VCVCGAAGVTHRLRHRGLIDGSTQERTRTGLGATGMVRYLPTPHVTLGEWQLCAQQKGFRVQGCRLAGVVLEVSGATDMRNQS